MDKKIVFAGGDKRQLYAAEKLRAEGCNVYISGFDKLKCDYLPKLEDFYQADVIVLPISGIKCDIIPAYYSDKELKLDLKRLEGKTVITGKDDNLKNPNCRIIDLLRLESFAEANALLSAEGALKVAIESFEGTIFGSKILVIGYGRIGKSLSRMLKALNAEVTVASRSDKKAEKIRQDGNKPVKTTELNSLSSFDLVFNTADAPVIDGGILRNSDSSVQIIDLASMPGGVDSDTAESLGFRTIHALGLPGKYSPKAAGEIISDAVLTIIKEE